MLKNWKNLLSDVLGDQLELFASILEDIHRLNGNAQAVGGWVRDALLDIPCKDLGVEVNLPNQKLGD